MPRDPALPPPRVVRYVRDDYEGAFGREGLARQLEEGRLRFPCCGELRSEGHHAACSKRPPDGPLPGQQALL